MHSIAIKQPDVVKSNDKFTEAVKPVFIKLLEAEAAFRDLDKVAIGTPGVLAELEKLEQMEKELLITWAKSTRDINPTMLRDVENNTLSYCPAIARSLVEILEIK